MRRRFTIGVTIEGVGPVALPTEQYMLVAMEPKFEINGFRFVECLHKFPDSVSQSVDWPGGVATLSSMNFEFLGDPFDPEWVQVVSFLSKHRPRPMGMLDNNINTTAASSFQYELLPGQSTASVDDYLYIQREKVRVLTTPGSADNDNDGKLEYTITVERGCHGTLPTVMDGTSPLTDRVIFKENPIVQGRRASVYRIDIDNQTATLKWTGLVESPRIESDGQVVKVNCKDSLAYSLHKSLGSTRMYSFGEVAKSSAGASTALTNTEPDWRSITQIMPINGTTSVFRFGEHIIKCQMANDYVGTQLGHRWKISSQQTTATSPAVMFGDPHAGTVRDSTQSVQKIRGWEVLVTRPNFTYFIDKDGNESSHVSDVVRCILCSTGSMRWGVARVLGYNGDFDALPPSWGCGVPDDLIDHTGFERLKFMNPWKDANLDNLVLGVEAQPQKARDVLNQILRPIGLSLVLNGEGKLTLKAFLPHGREPRKYIQYGSGASFGRTGMAEDDSWSQDHAEWPPMQNIDITANRQWPGTEYGNYLRHTDLNELVPRRFEGLVEDEDIDASFYGSGKSWNESQKRPISYMMRKYYGLRNLPLPVYGITSFVSTEAGQETDAEPLDMVFVNSGVAIGDGGARGVDSHKCVVLTCSWRTKFDDYRMRLMDLYYGGRTDKVIAPAWKVNGVTSDEIFTIQRYWFVKNGDPDLIDDWNTFETYVPDGTVMGLFDGNGNQVGSYDDTVDFDPATGTITMSAGGFGATVNIGDYVRFPVYASTSQGNKDQWAYIADKNAQLEGDAADVWSI